MATSSWSTIEAITSASPVSRVQALWTLEGLKSLDGARLKTAFADASPILLTACAALDSTGAV